MQRDILEVEREFRQIARQTDRGRKEDTRTDRREDNCKKDLPFIL
jgi:hypothetical protein